MLLSFWEKQNPTKIIKLRRKTPSPSKSIPLALKSHVLCGRKGFQCVFCLVLVFQHPQPEEKKVSTRLGALTRPGSRQARGQEFLPL